jgi:hypothetical protein
MKAADFECIRFNMAATLHELDLSGATLDGNALPNSALSTCTGLQTFVFPAVVTSIGNYAFYECSGLTGSLTLPAGVTSIGSGAFNNCSSLTGSLNLPTGLTSIGSNAFSGCSGFTGSLTLPAGLTSIVYAAFSGCSGFTGSLTLPAGLTSIENFVFSGCGGFGSLTLSAGTTSIGMHAFSGCVGLTGSLTLPAGVTSIGNQAFYNCSGLTVISVDAGNTAYSAVDGVLFNKTGTVLVACPAGKTGAYAIPATVTSIEVAAFAACSGLTGSLNLPAGVTSIGGHAFYGCSGFTGSLNLPAGLTSIGQNAFYFCSGFTGSLTLPAGLTSIEDYAFSGCSGFTAIYTHNPTPPTLGNTVFYGWNTVSDTLYVTGGSPSFYSTAAGWSAFTNIIELPYAIDITGSTVQTKLDGLLSTVDKILSDVASLKITGGDMTATDFAYIRENMAATLQELDLSGATLSGNAIPDNALKNFTDLQTFVFPAEVTSIGNYAFHDCRGLTGSLNLPAGLTSIGDYAFWQCSGFTGSLTLPAELTSIGDRAFAICSGFTGSLFLPAGVTSVGTGAFAYCSKLTGISVDADNTAYSSVDGVLLNKEKTALLACPEGKKGAYAIPATVTSIGSSAFFSCNGLTGSLTLPAGLTSIGDHAFSFCRGFTGSLILPAGVTSIGTQAFDGCSGLTGSLSLPAGMTAIGDYAFSNCIGFTGSLNLPEGVTSIGDEAFKGSSGFTSLSVGNATPPVLGNHVFDGWNTAACVLYVPAGSLQAYAATEGWRDFTDVEIAVATVNVELNDSADNPVDAPEARVLFYRVSAVGNRVFAADRESAGRYRVILPEGEYIVAAENVPGHLTTYYAVTESAVRWDDATKLTTEGQSELPIAFRMKPIPVIEEGKVEIDGYVTYEDGSEQKAKVARNATVGIYRSKKGSAQKSFKPDDGEWQLVRTVQPDEDGYFVVRNLPAGRYLVVADIPGYELTDGYEIDADNADEISGVITFSDNNFVVNDHTQTIAVEIPTSAPAMSESESKTFRLYPNPFAGSLHLTGAEGCTLRVFTSGGAVVHVQKPTGADETVHLERLPAGLYFFRLEKDGKVKTLKAVKIE